MNVTPEEQRPGRESRLLKPTPATIQPAQQAPAPLPPPKRKTDCPMEGGTGLAPHPTDCSKFMNCWKGTAYTQQCGPGTLFNPQTLQCDFPYNVNCIVSTPGPQGELNCMETCLYIWTLFTHVICSLRPKGRSYFSLFHKVQTGCTAYQASCSVDTWDSAPRCKAAKAARAWSCYHVWKKSSYTFTLPYPFISTLVRVFVSVSSCTFSLVPVDLYTA
jgi:hypothetical protein